VLRYLGFCLARISRSYPIQLGLNRPFLAPIVAVRRGSAVPGHRVDLRVWCQDLSGDKKVSWHRLLYFVSSGDYPVTKAGWAGFEKTLPEQEVDHFEGAWRRVASAGLEHQRVKDVLDAHGGPTRR
jgi:hypothetical protein